MRWIKGSERLPVGKVTAKHPYFGTGELDIQYDHAAFRTFKSDQRFPFRDDRLCEFEWLDESNEGEERKFSLKEVSKAMQDAMDFVVTENRKSRGFVHWGAFFKQYFKDKFNIDI